ncbi:MAG: nickel-dependent hydrogenase large subunit [Patescibacteria group bacterium]|nr:nickel-dependent hydrogenase large subunit [Patescibacteria group bacterium]
MNTFDVTIHEFAKIEGKARLTVKVKDNKIEDLQFAITEYKRFYTQALRDKDIMALPQLCSRICGTCSNAHLLCGIQAAEHALGITPSQQTLLLRKLVNFGLIIRDHALHCYVFALPDVLGIDNILELDETIPDQRQILDDTFQVKAAGNALGSSIGGRSVHAPYPMIGGFTKLPDVKEFSRLIHDLEQVRPAVLRLIQRFVECNFSLEIGNKFMTYMDDEYSFLGGKIYTSNGDVIDNSEYVNELQHISLPYSHASGYFFKNDVYMTGALARVNIAKDKLHPSTQRDAADALRLFPSQNLFHNNLAQAIEILHAIDRSRDILKNLAIQPERPQQIIRKSGIGIGIIEAPRGILCYKLSLNDKGSISHIQVIVPTGQNQLHIERSIRSYVERNLDKDKDALQYEIEKIVRAYDPCMSCASHFLKIRWIHA